MSFIFISYSHKDSEYAHRLAKSLEANGLEAWIDDRIDYGETWPDVIEEKVDGCSALIVVMTPAAHKSKWVKNELSRAQRKGKPVFPLLLAGDVWLSVEATQYADVQGAKLPPASFYSRLERVARLKPSLVQAGKPQPAIKLPPPSIRPNPSPSAKVQAVQQVQDLLVIDKPIHLALIRIPAGKFLMGGKNKEQRVDVAEFYIGKYPVTNVQYAAFVQAKNYNRPDHWKEGRIPAGKESHPVVNVSWCDAVAFSDWLSEATGRKFRLPTEAEWEKAARGGLRIPGPGGALRNNPLPARRYPWGDKFDKNKCNTRESGIGDTTPVGKYAPQGDSPYGLADMVGNVWEWCNSVHRPYPYNARDGREDLAASGDRVLRGGSWIDYERLAAALFRNSIHPYLRYYFFGFRVCAVLPPP